MVLPPGIKGLRNVGNQATNLPTVEKILYNTILYCAWPYPYLIMPHTKNQIDSYVHFWDTANSLFSITLDIPDHTHLEWLKK